jgi:hypothetical protein
MRKNASSPNKSGKKRSINTRSTHKGFTHIKDIINNIMVTSALPIDFDDIKIWNVWDNVVGETISRHARPSKIQKGVLTVKVSDSVWLQDLKFQAEAIRQSLNLELKNEAVTKIKFKVGDVVDEKS